MSSTGWFTPPSHTSPSREHQLPFCKGLLQEGHFSTSLRFPLPPPTSTTPKLLNWCYVGAFGVLLDVWAQTHTSALISWDPVLW